MTMTALHLDCPDCTFTDEVQATVTGTGAGAVIAQECPQCGYTEETETQYL